MLQLLAFFILAPLVLFFLYKNRERKRWEAEMIAAGKAGMFVKIAASGRSTVYHNPHCGKCRSRTRLAIDTALARGYVPCSNCGGQPEFLLLSDLEHN